MGPPLLRGGWLVVGVIACILSLSLAACLPAKPVPDDIVGLWVELHEDEGGARSPAPCTYFRFYPDGTFEAHNIPTRFFYHGDSRADTSGTWRLDTFSNDPFAMHKIILELAPIPGEYGVTTSVLFPVNTRDEFWTFVESPRAVFAKAAAACE